MAWFNLMTGGDVKPLFLRKLIRKISRHQKRISKVRKQVNLASEQYIKLHGVIKGDAYLERLNWLASILDKNLDQLAKCTELINSYYPNLDNVDLEQLKKDVEEKMAKLQNGSKWPTI